MIESILVPWGTISTYGDNEFFLELIGVKLASDPLAAPSRPESRLVVLLPAVSFIVRCVNEFLFVLLLLGTLGPAPPGISLLLSSSL